MKTDNEILKEFRETYPDLYDVHSAQIDDDGRGIEKFILFVRHSDRECLREALRKMDCTIGREVNRSIKIDITTNDSVIFNEGLSTAYEIYNAAVQKLLE